MEVYQYNVYSKETFNATGKAKGDILKILNKIGVKDLYFPSRFRVLRIIQQYVSLLGKNSNKLLFVQYPAVIDSFIKKAGSKYNMVAIIHDLQSIRGEKDAQNEISILNNFDILISHNMEMTNYLRSCGFKKPIINLEVFDYLAKENLQNKNWELSKKRISFAGNLNKSKFVFELNKIQKANFMLFGTLQNSSCFDKTSNVYYGGQIASDKIVTELPGEFGLIWDGDMVETCSGKLGNYLKFNNPHKLSLYIAAQKPIIIWSQAAEASFVLKNDIGFVVDSLYDIPHIIDNISLNRYKQIKRNINIVRHDVVNGAYTEKAIMETLKTHQKMEKNND